MKKEFETFKNLSQSYFVDQIKKNEPSSINFLDYRKYKVTIELVEESKDILIQRLENLLVETVGFNRRQIIKDEIKKLQSS